jgi:hypothetical protein
MEELAVSGIYTLSVTGMCTVDVISIRDCCITIEIKHWMILSQILDFRYNCPNVRCSE